VCDWPSDWSAKDTRNRFLPENTNIRNSFIQCAQSTIIEYM
jgi:hypothetical protein